MALMQINVLPLGTGSTSVGEFVAGIIKTLAREGVVCKLSDMGTLVEGDAEDLFTLARRIHEIPFLKGAKSGKFRYAILSGLSIALALSSWKISQLYFLTFAGYVSTPHPVDTNVVR